MCEHCSGYSRREVLRTGALALGAVLVGAIALGIPGCAEDQLAGRVELPDAYDDHLMHENGGGKVRIDPGRVVVPPPQPPRQSEYGSIMPRAAWTSLPLALRNGNPMGKVDKITIHHSGDGKPFLGTTVAEVARHLQIVQQAHLQRGMVDIAYHFAVDRSGRAWQLRYLDYEGQHVRIGKNGQRNNEHNIGVVVLGDFNVQNVTVQQRDRVVALVRDLADLYGLTDPKKRPRPNTVFLHGELVDTDCPGKGLKPYIQDARRAGQL